MSNANTYHDGYPYHIQAHNELLSLYESTRNGVEINQEEIQFRINQIHNSIHQMIFQGRQPLAPPDHRWWQATDEVMDEFANIMLQDEEVESAPQRIGTLNTTTRTLPRAVIETNCANACAICIEIPKKIDSLTTECGHEFCKGCYHNWFNSRNGNKCCPTCRKENPKVTIYKARAPRQTKTPTDVAMDELNRLAVLTINETNSARKASRAAREARKSALAARELSLAPMESF